MKRKLLIGLVFLIGFAIFSFPLFSNWYNNRVHYQLISDYSRQVDKLGTAEIDEQLEKARGFNKLLQTGIQQIGDPFLANRWQVIAGMDKDMYPAMFKENNVIGELRVPKIQVVLPIFHGISDDILARGIGYMPNTSLPVGGEGVHTVLTGHRGLPTAQLFRHLDQLEIGDVFYIKCLRQTLAYEVDQITVALPSQVEGIAIEEGKDYTTLLTCEPYMINSHRLLVRGHRIPYEEGADIAVSQGKAMFWLRYKEYIISFAIILLLALIIFLFSRSKSRLRRQQ